MAKHNVTPRCDLKTLNTRKFRFLSEVKNFQMPTSGNIFLVVDNRYVVEYLLKPENRSDVIIEFSELFTFTSGKVLNFKELERWNKKREEGDRNRYERQAFDPIWFFAKETE